MSNLKCHKKNALSIDNKPFDLLIEYDHNIIFIKHIVTQPKTIFLLSTRLLHLYQVVNLMG